MGSLILIVDPDAEHVTTISDALEQAKYVTNHVSTATDGMQQTMALHPALIITELDLPDEDGALFISTLRTHHNVPIVVWTARQGQAARILPFKLGADDVVCKTFGNAGLATSELVARVGAVLRRSTLLPPPETTIKCGRLRIGSKGPLVFFNGRSQTFSPTEYRIIRYLGERYGQVVSTADLVSTVWGFADPYQPSNPSNTVETHIWRIRQRLEVIGANQLIRRIRGQGYVLLDPDYTEEGDS